MKRCLGWAMVTVMLGLMGCSSTTGSSSIDVPSITDGGSSSGDNAPGTGIFGRVTSATDEPLASARVELLSADGALLVPAATTDADGQYTLSQPDGGIPDGAYLRVTPAGGHPMQAPMGGHGPEHLNVHFGHDGSMALQNGRPRG